MIFLTICCSNKYINKYLKELALSLQRQGEVCALSHAHSAPIHTVMILHVYLLGKRPKLEHWFGL